MDTKFLYVTAIAIAAVSSGYYYYSGKGNKLEVDSARNMTYSAEKINLTQTDDQGNLYVRAQVDRLEQDMQKQSSKLTNLKASTYKDAVVNANFYAKVANSYDDNQRIVLSQEVLIKKLMPQGEMQFKTTELTGYPKRNEIETDKLVTVQSPQADFVSQGLKANLNDGQYEFFNIRGKYEPKS